MASKNSVKPDIKNGYYHIYNRGVGKMDIFNDDADYGVFLSYLKEYLSPPPNKTELLHTIYLKDRVFRGVDRIPKNFTNKISLICYCLMPNHFHLLIKQNENSVMKDFVHSLLLRYSTYFNKKYDRVGPLFQGRFKAVLVENESYLLHLSKYIHLNPLKYSKSIENAKSSYADFLGLKHTLWVNPNIILTYFNKNIASDFQKINNYKKFVEVDNSNLSAIKDLVLE